MIIKLNNKTFSGAMVMGLLLVIMCGTAIKLKAVKKIEPISLWQLPKGIERQAVPVTGKVRNLSPPPLGSHHHPQ